jgi:hypothetical protein
MATKKQANLASVLARLRRRPGKRTKAIAGVVITRAERQRQQNRILSGLDNLVMRYDQMIEAARRSNREAEARLRTRRKSPGSGTRST